MLNLCLRVTVVYGPDRFADSHTSLQLQIIQEFS
jgi:hypothetical protein